MREVRAFTEDMAPQMILLMGLPAAGKSTFVNTQLTKYYQHRMPHRGAFKVINSDVQLRRFQYERAIDDFKTLKQIDDEDEWVKRTASMSYKSNDGAMIDFKLPHDQFVKMKGADVFWRKMYKSYYATYFGERAKAKKSADELADMKLGEGDVVIIDSTGVNTSKMLGYFKQGKTTGYTTSIVWLEIDPDYSVARDAYRGETEGRSVGEDVIRSYVPKIASAYKMYLGENQLVDRILHFRWQGEVVKGQYKLIRDLKRYPRKEKTKKVAARTMKRRAIAALLRAKRPDLANALAHTGAAAVVAAPEDRKPVGRLRFSTLNGDFVAVVGPVHARWKVRPIELYEMDDGAETFLGYVAPAKMKNIPRNRWAEGGKALMLLEQRGMLPEPGDPTPKPMGPAEQDKVRSRIRKHLKVNIALIQFFNAKRPWRESEERQYPNGTLFLLQRPDGMWLGRYKHSHGTTTSGGYLKGPVAAAKAATQRFIPTAAKRITSQADTETRKIGNVLSKSRRRPRRSSV